MNFVFFVNINFLKRINFIEIKIYGPIYTVIEKTGQFGQIKFDNIN